MLDTATALRYYKREDVQEAIVHNARGRELAVQFSSGGFGKRPDTLTYPQEVLDFVKKGVTSFHVSEERWSDPLELSTSMKRHQMDELRSGWDLVIDIDSENWDISRIATALIVRALRDFSVHSATVKFSGNKGFHIGVPFEAFPGEVVGTRTGTLFPELPKKIASFLVDYINENYIAVHNNVIDFGGLRQFSYDELRQVTDGELVNYYCRFCKEKIEKNTTPATFDFVCPLCGSRISTSEHTTYKLCEKCNTFMERVGAPTTGGCSCGSRDLKASLNPLAVIDIDTLLLSSRHMYRCAFSLHEKSGLASVHVPADQVMHFDKQSAHPDKVTVTGWFLDASTTREGEALELVQAALDHKADSSSALSSQGRNDGRRNETDFEELMNAAPRDFFPPCIRGILGGIQDGRKRALFVLLTFLNHVGWSYEQIEELIHEWNANNPEGLKETLLNGHLRYHRHHKVLPPNCSNSVYYTDMRVCHPDNLCRKIRNPINYTRRRVHAQGDSQKGESARPTSAEGNTSRKNEEGTPQEGEVNQRE